MKKRQHLFGKVIDGQMCLNTYGKIAEEELVQTSVVRPNVIMDGFVVMPNHIHALIRITRRESDTGRGVMHYTSTGGRRLQSPSHTVGSIVRGIKSAVTNRIRRLPGGYIGDVWQRNYHDSIVTDGHEVFRYRTYIANNPRNWHTDDENR